MRKTGRPKIEDGDKRDVRIQLRMNEKEADALDELCVYFKCDRSSLIRSLVSKIHSDIYGGEINANNS